MVDPWSTLGIAPTDDTRRIKKAYAARVKRAHPEDDPAGFQELRQAYELALAFARWHKNQCAAPGEPRYAAAPQNPVSPAPVASRDPRKGSPPDLAGQDSSWVAEAVAMLMKEVKRLHDDDEAWASETAWRGLLANESLWNIDTRRQFERYLIEHFVRNAFALSPAIWCLLEQEFHWTEQTLSLYRFLPRDVVNRVLERIEHAPIERAEQLCAEGSYREAKALLEPIANDRRSGEALAASARRLLDLCVAGETAEGTMREVERLRADERAWDDLPEWRALLGLEALRDGETRSAFQRRLFAFLVRNGQGLSGAVWRLLNTTYRWSTLLPADEFARALEPLGPAIAENIERLREEGHYQEVIAEWARVIDRLEGDAGRRGRLVLERCCLRAIERAEGLGELARYAEAVDEVGPCARQVTGGVGDRARGILDRYSIAAVQLAEHLYDMKDFRGAIEQVGPIVSWLQGELGTRARLVLSRSYLLDSSPEKAERPLKELLKADPRSIPAHLLLAVVYRSRGQLVLARDAYVQVLKLDPDNAHAEKELRDVRAQLGQPEAEAAALRAEAVTAHPGRTTAPPPHPRVSDAAPPEAEGSTSPSLGFIWWLLTLAVLSSRQVSGIDIDGRVLLTLMMVLLVGGAIVALWLWRRQATETTPTLGLGLGRETATPRPSDTVETRTHPAVVLASLLGAIGVLAVILVWAWRTPAQPSVPRAARLLDQGVAAFDAKDYAKAAGLLKRAADADPRLKDIFERLGRALHELGRSEDAISAFTRQVEVAPRHERAYAWRAYVLLADGRWADAEKDLLKQIEVAPSQAWSYEKLGERRMLERRFAEAVDFYARAAAIEPKLAQRWLDLGVAQAEAESPAEARRSLDKAMGLGPEDWMRVTAARTHLALGDLVKAGVLARSALQPLTRRLNRLRPELFGEADLYWVERLVEAWTLVGRAAAADGDAAEAERYLEAAWRVGFAPEAGNALSQLRKRQGRNREALELRHLAASVARWDPRQFGPPVLGASRPAPQPAAEAGLMELRTIELSGPSPADVTGRVLLLADADGRVETVSRLSRESEALDLQLASLAPIRLSWPRPDQEPFRIVKRGLLACSAESGCALVLDLPGEMSLPEVGKVRIVSQDPREGQLLIVGQRVAVSVTVQYELDSDEGMLELLVVDKASRSMVKLASQTVTASSGQTTLTGTLAVPDGAAGVGVLVSLRSRQASAIPVVAVAHFGVKTR